MISPLLLLLTGTSLAVRPTEGGMFSFDDADVVASWEEPGGVVRVHYSVEGPNVVRAGDADQDGVPDFAQDVAITAAEVIDFYSDTVGLRRPLSEDQVGLSALGGSYAFDFYLVDFAGNADGMFSPDGCADGHCAGHMVMENDFAGYGYPSISMAIEVLTSHELFHAVQNAYAADQVNWFAEGTAVWGENQWDPGSLDFMWFADSYLESADRSLDKPPTGPVPAFAYGTCLWWDFLTTRHDTELMNELQEATDDSTGDPLLDMASVIEGRADTLEEAWTTFVSWNLATGDRAGALPGYSYATRLDGIHAEAEGTSIDDDNRFYPLAATYYRLDHQGGPLWFGLEEEAAGLHFALHPVKDGAADGPVEPAAEAWYGEAQGKRALLDGADLPAGGYWLAVTYPQRADASTKVRLCLGDEAAASACTAGDEPEDTGTDEPEEPGKGCSSTGLTPLAGAWGLIALMRRRRSS
ncbi:MAG: hypothetical protein JXX28_08760 [Deltaproteobacteria bacterium]|nr:hypothetical protein [Deltaproteobacteria bacterium]